MIGGFSLAVDLIQAEYNTPHEEILNMPICTLRQKIANIEKRRKDQRLYRNTIAEWQTRTLAQFIAATVPTDKGKRNPLADEAAKIRLRIEDSKGKADNDVSMETYIEQGSQTAENKPGSYERLLAGFPRS